MKKIISTLILIYIFALLLAQQGTDIVVGTRLQNSISDDMTIEEVAKALFLPSEYLKDKLDISSRDIQTDKKTIIEFEVERNRYFQIFYEYHNFNDESTLEEVCKTLQIPYKKIASYLKINPQDEVLRNKQLSFFILEPLDILELQQKFNNEMQEFSSSLVILAMILTFLTLLLIAFAISKLTIVEKKFGKKQPTIVNSQVGKVILEANDCLNSDVVVAVVAAIERYRAEKTKDHQIMLTWRRANVSIWQASSKLFMPNQSFNIQKK